VWYGEIAVPSRPATGQTKLQVPSRNPFRKKKTVDDSGVIIRACISAVRPSLQPPAGGMAPKRGGSKQQQQLNVDQFTLLKKPMEHLGKINVPGSFWQGRMLEEERDKI
jgi:hypothetical protein